MVIIKQALTVYTVCRIYRELLQEKHPPDKQSAFSCGRSWCNIVHVESLHVSASSFEKEKEKVRNFGIWPISV